MKALVKFSEGRKGMGIQEVPEPHPGNGQIKIKVDAAGICGSDIHSMNDERKTVLPVILGHEFVGQVCEIGDDVTDFQTGDWVVALPAVGGCGQCVYCKNGEYTLCDHRASIGTHMAGAMAEYLVIPASFAFHVPDNVKDKRIMAIAEPLSCATRGIMERINVRPGDIAVVSGPGIFGLLSLQLLKLRGARIVVSGLSKDAERLALAKELGADAVAVSPEELMNTVKAMNPLGADIAVETSGSVASVHTCIDVLKKHGSYLQIAVFSKDIPFPMDDVLHKEIYVTGTNSTAMSSWKIAMDLVRQEKLRLEPLVSLQLPLAEWEKGFDVTIDKTAYKVFLLP